MRISALVALSVATLALSSCGGRGDGSAIDVAYIGDASELDATGLRLSPAAQQVRAATAEGLVAFDAAGTVVPAMAERWIVTDDGLSYIFRLRNSTWADGTRIDGQDVRAELTRTIGALRGTSLGLDLASVDDIRAMTGRVVEIRLKRPMPHLLQLLAQPELGLRHKGRGTGPMDLEDGRGGRLLNPLPPEKLGLPKREDWADSVRPVHLEVLPARQAVAAFGDGHAELLLGGTMANLPLADTGALSRGTVRLDAALGLFGLQVRQARGVLEDSALREAVAMAIDRDTLVAPFNIGGWVPSTRVVPASVAVQGMATTERWAGQSLDDRRALASRRVAAWRAGSGQAPSVTLALPAGPGSELLFGQLKEDLGAIGIALRRAGKGDRPDLVLLDRTARYGGPEWFLNQLNCRLAPGPCSPDADADMATAAGTADAQEHARLLAGAEQEMLADNFYIPFGAPIRWSLVRGDVDGFEANPWNVHPLLPLSKRPI